MWSPLLLQCTWWLVSTSKKRAMVEYEVDLQGWLEEATLFPAEPNDYGFNFDDILSSGKTNDEQDLLTGLPDLDWLDAQADLSILDGSKGLNIPAFQIDDPLNLDNAADFLLDLIDNSNLDSSYLSSDVSKSDLNNIFNPSTQIELSGASPNISVSSPYYESISEASSPASSNSEILYPDVCLSPGGISSVDDGGYESISEAFTPASPGSVLDPGTITVTVCDMDTSGSPADKMLSIEEVTRSVRKRRFVNDGKEIPKVHVTLKDVFHPYMDTSSSPEDSIEDLTRSVRKRKDIPKVHVTLKDAFHPYAKPAPAKRSGGKRERKKIQNKEAAARYRIKKRVEEQQISGVVEGLEQEQEELNKKHDELLSEIKYLKKLMREVLEKKGVLK